MFALPMQITAKNPPIDAKIKNYRISKIKKNSNHNYPPNAEGVPQVSPDAGVIAAGVGGRGGVGSGHSQDMPVRGQEASKYRTRLTRFHIQHCKE